MAIACTCQLCGKAFERFPRDLRRGGGKYCSWDCRRQAQRRSGNRIKTRGYIRVYESGGSTHAEHRAIMEFYLGRPLLDDELVHHIDGNRENNQISNLQVMSAKEHSLIHNGLNGRWALHHESCVECSTTEREHIANGLCSRCHNRKTAREWRQKHPGYRGAGWYAYVNGIDADKEFVLEHVDELIQMGQMV